MSTDEFIDRDELLTQDERDALMEVVSKKSLTSSAVTSEFREGVASYDLSGCDYAINSLLPVLETIHERFAHRLRIGLFDLLHRELTVISGAIEKRSHTDLSTSLNVPCSVNVISMAPLKGPALLIFDQELVFMIVDTFFGGTGRLYKTSNVRDFTATESRFIQRLLDLSFRCLQEAWEPFASLVCTRIDAENKPQFITAINPGEWLAVGSVHVSRDATCGVLHLALPYSTLEPMRKTLLDHPRMEAVNPDPQLADHLLDGLKESPVDAHCFLAGFELALSELLALKVGDVISVNIPATATLRIEDVPIYSGVYGVAEGWRALKIDQALRLPGGWSGDSTLSPTFAPFEAKA